MANQPLAFAQLLAGGVLVTAGVSGHSPAKVLAGNFLPIRPLVSALPEVVDTAGASSGGGPSNSTVADVSTADPDLSNNPTVKQLQRVKGISNFEGVKVAAWIKPILQYARRRGWRGKVNSGYRSYAEQERIYNSGVRPAAKPGQSNHQGDKWPRGAIDVTDAQQLAAILKNSPFRNLLVWAGAADPVHFSFPHNGSY